MAQLVNNGGLQIRPMNEGLFWQDIAYVLILKT